MDTSSNEFLIEIQQLSGIDASKLVEIGLITSNHAKKWIVRQKYFHLAKTGRTYADIKYELSIDYGISVSAIEKIIYRK